MNLLKRAFILLVFMFTIISFVWLNKVNALDYDVSTWNVKQWQERNDLLDDFWVKNTEYYKMWDQSWAQWIKYLIVNVAGSLKNLFFALATLFYLIIVFKILVASNSEEEFWKFKKWIIWITIWIVIMQIAYTFVSTIYGKKELWNSMASNLITNIVDPFIWLFEMLASMIFLSVAIYAFYRLVTANWKEEEATKAKMTIVYAIIWFILLKIVKVIVNWVYSVNWNPWYEKVSSTIMQIINWVNWFVAILTLLLIIYAWFNIMFSNWDEEKIKKAKATIVYIAIWMFLLIANYLILIFFIFPK